MELRAWWLFHNMVRLCRFGYGFGSFDIGVLIIGIGILGSWHNDFPSVYHNKLYFDRLYLAPVMER
jgi:hypothetical protein